MKTAFIYPGQGSQYVGMSSEFYRDYKECKDVIDRAAEVVDFDLKHVLFEENDLIGQTEYTQTTILVTAQCMETAVRLKGYAPDAVAGLSLGEYNALIAAGALDFEDAVKLVRIRGKLMQDVVPVGKGAMVAIIKVPEERVVSVCDMVTKETGLVVAVSNYNCPGQLVISGESQAVDCVCEHLVGEARLISRLKVSVPSHCKLMYPITEQFREELAKVQFKPLKIPYFSNVTGKIVTDYSDIPELLIKQLYLPVLWYQSIRSMIETGVTQFVETGPKSVLTSYMHRIDRNVKGISMKDIFEQYKLDK